MSVDTVLQLTHILSFIHINEHQARQRLHNVAQFSAASNPISSRAAEEEEGESGHSDTQSTTNGKATPETNVATSISSSGGGDEEKYNEDPVIQSAVMLRFGAEVPSLVAAGKCGRTVQFPIPDDWNDPEVRERNRKSKIKKCPHYIPRNVEISLNRSSCLLFL